MNALLRAIEQWIGPKWASVIAFAAIYGVSLPDLSDLLKNFMEYTSGNPDLLAKGGIAAFIAYLFRRARPVEGAVTKPVMHDDDTLFEASDYETPAVTVRKPAKNWFTDAEMDCKCQDEPGCDYRGMHPTVIAMANDLRERFGVLITNSGYRCPIHNRAVGGEDDSYHLKAMACDLKSPTVAPATLYAYLDAKYPKMYGLGLYKTFVHLDCRSPVWARKVSPDTPWIEYDKPDINL